MENNIKTLMGMIPHGKRSGIIQTIADEFGKSFGTVKSHWLSESGGFSVPEPYRERTVELLQNHVKLCIDNIKVESEEVK